MDLGDIAFDLLNKARSISVLKNKFLSLAKESNFFFPKRVFFLKLLSLAHMRARVLFLSLSLSLSLSCAHAPALY